MLWLPANKLVVSAACGGSLVLSVPDPRTVVPSRKFTLPVGRFVTPRTLEPVTVAVNVTGAPALGDLLDETSAVVSPLALSNTPTPEKDIWNPLATTSGTPSPFTSTRAKSQAQRSAANSSGA